MIRSKSVVFISTPNTESANLIAESLVENRLAACVNIISNLTSVFKWEGQIQKESESLLICKTQSKCFEGLRAKVAELHPYENPEIIALDIQDGSHAYLDWITQETSINKTSADMEEGEK